MAGIRLYDISEEIRYSLEVLFSGDVAEGWEEQFDKLEIALEEKGLAIRHVLREMSASSDALAAEIKRLYERKKIFDNAEARLKAYTMDCMEKAGRDEIKVDGIGLKIVKTPAKAIVFDVDALQSAHPEMVDIIPQSLKARLDEVKKWEKSHGESPSGTEITRGTRLRVD